LNRHNGKHWWEATISPNLAKSIKAAGCQHCRHTGFKCRSGIYEMLTITPNLRKRITPETDLQQLAKLARQQGMQPLIINGVEKVAAGITSIEELLKIVPPLETD
jgi:general secretion pathway protein E